MALSKVSDLRAGIPEVPSGTPDNLLSYGSDGKATDSAYPSTQLPATGVSNNTPVYNVTGKLTDSRTPHPYAGYIIVDAAGGGDYTSIVTAINAEGAGKKYLIREGTYNEGATAATSLVFPASHFVFQNVTVNLSDNVRAQYGTNMTGTGDVLFVGKGLDTEGWVLYIGAVRDLTGLTTSVQNTRTTAPTGWFGSWITVFAEYWIYNAEIGTIIIKSSTHNCAASPNLIMETIRLNSNTNAPITGRARFVVEAQTVTNSAANSNYVRLSGNRTIGGSYTLDIKSGSTAITYGLYITANSDTNLVTGQVLSGNTKVSNAGTGNIVLIRTTT